MNQTTLDYIIRNGAKIAENGLGAILPTAESLRVSDRLAEQHRKAQDKAARQASELMGLERMIVGGEHRYYANDRRYAIINRRLRVQWFEKRGQDWFSVK